MHYLGEEAVITRDKDLILSCDKVILPGVGSFGDAMALVLFFFYQYIAILVEEETGKKRTLDLPARIFLVISEVGAMTLPITYIETPDGNYSAGLYAYVSYASVAVYLILCSWLLLANWKSPRKTLHQYHRAVP